MINLVTGETFNRTNYVHKLNCYMNNVYKDKLRNKCNKEIKNIYKTIKENE